MSDTPRTDALVADYYGSPGRNEWAQFARQLERELADLQKRFDAVWNEYRWTGKT